MRIYNLFPLLAGTVKDWRPHLKRAADLGFDSIFVNPIQLPGQSGSLYSIRDFFKINPLFIDRDSSQTDEEQVKAAIAYGESLGLRFVADLVINHCAYDSALLKQHPEWFVRENGRVVYPSCDQDGERVEWQDLAQFDHRNSKDAEGLYEYCRDIVDYLMKLGFRGLRCDAAYQIPAAFWHKLIQDTRKKYPDALFMAETLGCSPEQTRETAHAGFDFIFNSSKWWDFSGSWLMEQYQATRNAAPSISFPESHDTPRLYAEMHGNLDALRQRYLFAALFSASVMMPMGYEFGFSRPLHVVNTRPSDWETTQADITGFIRHINMIKTTYPIFSEECENRVLETENPSVLVLSKKSGETGSEALVILNKDPWNWQHFHTHDLCEYLHNPAPLRDVSPEWPMEYLPKPFEFELMPGMGRILVTGRADGQLNTISPQHQ